MKVALVTGASSGLGRELAKRIARREGWLVIASGRDEARLAGLRAEAGPGVVTVAGDIRDPGVQQALAAEAARRGGLDLLVNNAGFNYRQPLATLSCAEVEEMAGVNAVAPAQLIVLTLPLLTRSRGTIANVSSVLGDFSVPLNVLYSATKHFLNGLTRGLSLELAGTGVRVVAICPAGIRTDFVRRSLRGRPRGTPPLDEGETLERVADGVMRGLFSAAPGLWLFPTPRSRLAAFAGRHFRRSFDALLSWVRRQPLS